MAHQRYERALERLDSLLSDPALPAADRAQMQNKRGVCLLALRRQSEARFAFAAALECVAGFAPALVNQGNLALEDGEVEASIALYRRAIERDPEYALAHHNLGVAYKRLGRTAEAVRALREAHRLEGRGARAPQNTR